MEKREGGSTDKEKLRKIPAQLDHVVVSDFGSEKGFKSVTLASLVDTPRRYKLFIGTAKECQAWVDAPDAEARQEVERWAAERLRKRIPLPSESSVQQQVAGLVDKFKLKVRHVQTSLFGTEPSQPQDQELKR